MTKAASKPRPADPYAHLHGDVFTLVLPFPNTAQRKALSPNGRGHWRSRAAETKKMKTLALYLTIGALPSLHQPWEAATLTYRFYPPDARGRDRDNYCAIMKPAVDGIVKGALLTDDNWGVLTPGPEPLVEIDRARPRVEITIQRSNP